MSKSNKGARFERYFANRHRGELVPHSGSYKHFGRDFTGDVRAYGLTWELKSRRDKFGSLHVLLGGCELALVSVGNHPTVAILLESTFIDVLKTKRTLTTRKVTLRSGFECMYRWLNEEHIDALALKKGNYEPIIVMPLDTLKKLVRGEEMYQDLALQIGKLVEDKQKSYGDSFNKCGEYLKILYPNGIAPYQYKDVLCLARMFDKQMRIANKKEAFGESPYRDIMGYAILGLANDLAKEG